MTLVVDTGANALAGSSIYGYAQAVRPSNRLMVVNTEKHFDHIGGNSVFRKEGIEIWGHRKLRRTEDELKAEVQEFNDAIQNPARRAATEASVFFSDTILVNPDRVIDTEMSFDLGGCDARVIVMPGHTETNLSIWTAQDRVLFSGDCLINGYLPKLDACTPDGWRTWLDSLRTIEALDPQTVVPGHGPVARAESVQRILHRVRETLRTALEIGHSPTAPASQRL